MLPGRPKAWIRLQRLVMRVAGFTTGSAAAAMLVWLIGMWCFVVSPPLVVAAPAVLRTDAATA
jgi:hypothetical protein